MGQGPAAAPGRTWSWPVEAWDAMWRPRMWRLTPPTPHRAHLLHVGGILLLVAGANVVVNEFLGPPWYVPFNLGVLAAALAIARSAGTTWTSMGMRADRVRRGAVVGGVLAAAVIAATAVLVAIPDTRTAFEDDRIVEGSVALSMYHALIRIPLGTALYEEVLFRGILFGMFARRVSPLAAAAWSSLLFGIWHVLPVVDALGTNPIGDALGTGTLPILAAVAVTFAAGLGFVWIRLYAGSIVAPVIVHIATNSTAVIAATVVVHVL